VSVMSVTVPTLVWRSTPMALMSAVAPAMVR
jgi:hypothetical protein